MLCPSCSSPISYCGGENTKDHGCHNMQCPARVEAKYYGNVSIIPGWYFAESYTWAFKRDGEWYCVSGSCYSGRTYLKKIETFYWHGIQDWNHGNPIWGPVFESSQHEVYSIPYMALPANQDFNREFDVLLTRFDEYFKPVITGTWIHPTGKQTLFHSGLRLLKKKRLVKDILLSSGLRLLKRKMQYDN